MSDSGFFVLLDPSRGYWTGRKWSQDVRQAKRFSGPRSAYTRAREVADRLSRAGRGSALVSFISGPEIATAHVPKGARVRAARRKNE